MLKRCFERQWAGLDPDEQRIVIKFWDRGGADLLAFIGGRLHTEISLWAVEDGENFWRLISIKED